MPDRIVAATYMAAAAVTGGNVTLRDVDNTHILPMLADVYKRQKYALLVFFDEPDDDTNGGYNGGNAVAGPYFAKMMEEILPYLGVEAQYLSLIHIS